MPFLCYFLYFNVCDCSHLGKVFDVVRFLILIILQSSLSWLVIAARPGHQGNIHTERHTGMCHTNVLLFHKKKILKNGSSYKNIPKHGCLQYFWVFAPPLHPKIVKNVTYISRKIPKNGYVFLSKTIFKYGKGFPGLSSTPCPNQIWVTPDLVIDPRLYLSNNFV